MPIHVAHLTTIDGSLRYLLLNQLTSLQNAGYRITGISSPGPNVESLTKAGIRHIAVPFVRSSTLTPTSDLGAFWRLSQVFRRERFTIVHTHTAKPDLYGTIAARLAGVPIVLSTLHGFYFHENMPRPWHKFYATLAKISALQSDVILSQNSEDIGTAAQEKICPPEKIRFLGNGIDLCNFDRSRVAEQVLQQKRLELNLRSQTPVVGFVGRLVRDKGLLELLAAARQVREQIPSVRFLIIGPANPEKADGLSPAVAEEFGVADACIFTGRRHDLPELYSLMNVFVLPSHREAFPRTPMEASAMGVPCVVTDVRGCREAVKHGRNGLVVPLGDVDALAEAIVELLADRAKAQRMGLEGCLMARQNFDERTVFERVNAAYVQLLSGKGLNPPQSTPMNVHALG